VTDPSGSRPLINHIAISVDAAVLDVTGRADLVRFFGQVFGWTEGDNSTEAGNPLILYTGRSRQYLYLLPAADDFLRAPMLDHFGLEVSSLEELSAIVERAEAYRLGDDRVSVSGIGEMVTHGTASDFTLTNAYIAFLLPLQIELQYIAERATS
jgi:hypothetical protein